MYIEVILGDIGIVEKKMETIIGFRVKGLGFRIYCSGF